MSILFPKYRMQAYNYDDGSKYMTERSDYLDMFDDYKGKSNYCIEIKEGKRIVYTERPDTIAACEQQLDDVSKVCHRKFGSVDQAIADLDKLKTFPEYPDFPAIRFGEGTEDYILRREAYHDKRLSVYTDLLTARDACMKLDEEFVNEGQVDAFKDNRRLMSAYDHAIDAWKGYLGKVFKPEKIKEAESEADVMIASTQQEQEIDAGLEM